LVGGTTFRTGEKNHAVRRNHHSEKGKKKGVDKVRNGHRAGGGDLFLLTDKGIQEGKVRDKSGWDPTTKTKKPHNPRATFGTDLGSLIIVGRGGF